MPVNSSRQPPLGKQLAIEPPLQNLSADVPKTCTTLKSQSHRFWLNLVAPLNMEIYEDIDLKIMQQVANINKQDKKVSLNCHIDVWNNNRKRSKREVHL